MSNDVMRPNVEWFRRRPEAKVQDPYDKANDQGIVFAKESRVLRERNELAKALTTLLAAKAQFRKACQIDPHLHQAVFNLGVILIEEAVLLRAQGEPLKALALLDEADVQFRKALDIEPSLLVAENNLGSVAYERAWLLYDDDPMRAEAEFTKAEMHSRKVLEGKPDWADMENNIGNSIFERAGLVRKRVPDDAPALYREAETHYRRALEIDPNSSSAERYWGRVLFALAGFHRERTGVGVIELCIDAELHYRRALEIDPKFVDALDDLCGVLLWKAVALREQGRHDEAMAAALDVLGLSRKQAELTGGPSYNLACALALTGESDLAIATLEELVRGGMLLNPAWLRQDPDLQSIRGDRRFRSLLQRLEERIS